MNGKVLNKEALKVWILSKMVTLTNNLLATTPGISAMDAAQGPVIQGQIDAINSNFGDGQISFSVVDGEPYVKVGADAPRPFSGDCVINIPGTVELYGYDNGTYKSLRTASIALKVQVKNRTATISSSASFSTSQYPGGWMGKVSFGSPSVTR